MTRVFVPLSPIERAKALNAGRIGDEYYIGTADEKPAFNHSHHSPDPLL
jgi:hypothetical protein